MRKSFLPVSSLLASSLFALAMAPSVGQQPAAGPQAGQPSPAPQSSPKQMSEEEAMAMAAQTAQATMNWDASGTPGTKVEVLLIKKSDYHGKPMMDYRLKISGAPRGQQYALMAWPVMLRQPVVAMEGLAIAADGTVGCPADSTKSCAQRIKGAELHLTYVPSQGEIYRHALISEDHQTRIFFSIVPDPITATDQACSLEVVRLSPQFELVMVRGKGFQPGEVVRFRSQSYQEVHDAVLTADPHGEFQAHITPTVQGRAAGTSTVVAAGKNCSPSISFDWGAPPAARPASSTPASQRQ